MALPKAVKLVEVGPRDGLQNEIQWVETATKIELIHRLSKAGLRHIEATSFVSPEKIKQLSDAATVCAALDHTQETQYAVLVPNEQGMNNALAAGARAVGVFTAATEQFCQHNINCSIEQSFQRFEPVMDLAQQHHVFVRGYLSCCLGCPYEGAVSLKKITELVKRLDDLGCDEISLGDTIGVGTPQQAQHLVMACAEVVPLSKLAVHFHDTYGQALANIYAALEVGIHIIDSSVSGLGGCPYAKGATGNVATEEVVYLLNGLGIECGVDLDALIEVSLFIAEKLKRPAGSKVTLARANS